MFHTLYESLLLFLFAVLSISPRTPTRSDIDCYARRIAPYTVTSRCKSFIENVEVFPREACIILEFGCGLCSCLGAGPAATVLLLFCSSSLLFLEGYGGMEAGRQEGLQRKHTHTQTKCRTGIDGEQAFLFKSAFSCASFCRCTELLRCLLQNVGN